MTIVDKITTSGKRAIAVSRGLPLLLPRSCSDIPRNTEVVFPVVRLRVCRSRQAFYAGIRATNSSLSSLPQIPSQDISEYVEGFCRNWGVSQQVQSTTFDVIDVAKNTWISQVRFVTLSSHQFRIKRNKRMGNSWIRCVFTTVGG